MAGALRSSVPVALVYSFFVDNYVSGLTAGAVKSYSAEPAGRCDSLTALGA